MRLIEYFRTPEFQIGDFLVPWGMVISAMGFFVAWIIVIELERRAITRQVWHVPLFFVAFAVLCGCLLGLLFAP